MAATTTMFMHWKVPTRLYNQDPTTASFAGPPPDKTGYSKFTDHRKVSKLAGSIPPSYLTRKTHAPTTTTHFTPKQGVLRQMREHEMEEQIMREKQAPPKKPSSGVTRFPAMPVSAAKLNAKQTSDVNRPRDAGVMPVPNNAVTMSGRIRKEITQEDKNYINNAYKGPSQTETAKVVNKWLESASDKDKELAFQFFSSLAGKKLMGGDQAAKEGRPKASASCNVSDATRLKDVLGALKTSGGPTISNDIKGLKPGESNRRRLRLLSPFTRRHKEEMQSWHHLPTFRHRGPVSNTIGIFTRPHKPVPRHFSIHPEWE